MPIIAAIVALSLLGQGELEVTDIKKGQGPAAKDGDILTMSYRGTFKSGKLFDESKGRPPFVFRLGAGQVIKGWDKGLVGMQAGGRRKLVIPASLAYGDKDRGPIPANSTLVFEVEALRIESPTAEPKVEIRELKKGTGAAVTATSTVKCHYRGSFLNGVEFDKSVGGDPFEVAMGQGMVIPGFEQGLLGMRVGGKRKVTIPFKLGYGEQGSPPTIPRMSTLVFELEVLSVKG